MAAKTFLKPALTIFAMLFLLAHLTFAAIPRYEIIDLGTLGGDWSRANSINSSGQIVGYAYNSSDGRRATLFDPMGNGNNLDLGTLGGDSSSASAINDAGRIVGTADINSAEHHATWFDPTGNGTNIALGTLGGKWSYALSINDNGQVVGTAYIDFSYFSAALFDPTGNENNINLGTLGGDYSVARSINTNGQIVGEAKIGSGYDHATLFDASGSGNNMDLGTLGGTTSTAYSINDLGQIVGWAYNSDQDKLATLFDTTFNGNNTALGSLGYAWSEAKSINNKGQIVGWAYSSPGIKLAAFFDITGNGNNIDLNTLIDPPCGWILTCAYSINDNGWIVGEGFNPDGEEHAFLMTPVPPKIIYVDDDADGANDGSSWPDAFNYLQDALTAAWPCDEVRVAQGTYTPDSNSADPNGSGDRTATFQLINGVTLKGGYAGCSEINPNARDFELYETILSGDLAGDDARWFKNRSDNSFHIVSAVATDETAVLDGFTVTGGNAISSSTLYECGGGMYCVGDATVLNCKFILNAANVGGGIGSRGPNRLTLTGCAFRVNEAVDGGGIYSDTSDITLTDCTFGGNSVDKDGGGMYNSESTPTLANCTFATNWAKKSGAGMFNLDSSLTLTYSTFKNNYAYLQGGGIYNHRSGLILASCIFVSNGGAYGLKGGAMYNTAADTTLTNCTFARNAGDGEALACDSPGQLHPSTVQVTNCIFWDHDSEIWNNDNSSIVISYSDVRGGWPGQGNINADPLFVNPGGVENLRLAESSPCIDTGDPNYIPEPNETDFDGFPRIVGGRIDMGVYEFQGRLILYVDNDASGSNDGSSWANAYNCLQDALITADPIGGPIEIRVAEGTYKPDQGVAVTPGDRQASFGIKPRVTVKGGYAGFGEPDPNARDIKLHETILSGDLADDDGPNFENYDENSYNVVRGGALGETTILDGFTITGGNANDFKSYKTRGGGIHVFPDINFTIKNCTIIRNRAKSNGGGIYSGGSSSCCFTINNCRFIANRAGLRGGAISLGGESMPNISNCVFAGNSAESGGAIGNIEGYLRIINCTFTGNHALDECGGVIDYDGASHFKNCILWANTDKGGADESAQFMFSWSWGSPLNYSCIQGWTGALGGIGNINEDPLFVDPGYWNDNGTPDDANDDIWVDGDYHLLPNSPCIDTGDPNYVAEPNETDLDGKPRVISSRIDMGVYEYGPQVPAEVRIVPKTINLASKGKWITCYIQLPENYDVVDINPNSIFLEGEIKPEQFSVDEQQQVATARFTREDVQPILGVGDIDLTIAGRLTDGTVLEAKNTIKVVDKEGKK